MSINDNGAASSARKLAAGIWRRQIPTKSSSTPIPSGYVNSHCICNLKNSLVHGNHLQIRHERTNSAMERSTKWDHPNHFPHKRDLQLDLNRAQNRVADLKAECDLWRKNLSHLFRKTLKQIEDEENLKISLEAELKRERKERRLQESLNSKLTKDVAAAKALARQRRHEYEDAKKARELVEEIREDLVEDAGKTREEMEFLRKEMMEIQQELERDKRMLQVAETWREERVRMKMMDAKIIMEEKHLQVCEVWPDFQRREVDVVGDDDDDDDDSSMEETMSRSDELDSSVPSVG